MASKYARGRSLMRSTTLNQVQWSSLEVDKREHLFRKDTIF